MYAITRSKYIDLVEHINTIPYCYPPLSLQKELDEHDGIYIGWAIWCLKGLPEPKNEFEENSKKMILNYLQKNLRIIEDDEIDRLEGLPW